MYSDAELAAAKERNISDKYANGTIWPTLNYGTFKIIGKDTKSNYYLIQFTSDNQIQSVRSNQLKDKKVRNNWHINKCKAWLIANNESIEILSDSYVNVHNKMEFRCKTCNHQWTATWSRICNSSSRCPKCDINRRKNGIDGIKERLKIINDSIEILDDTYINAHTKLELKCLTCGNRWRAKWYSLDQGHGCPVCANDQREGEYGLAKAETNKQSWLKKDAVVYSIKCSDDDEVFYKIGISASNLKYRFNAIPYNCKVLELIHTNLYEAIYKEKELHQINKLFRYNPKKSFGGWTECFSQLYNAAPNVGVTDTFTVPAAPMNVVM